MPTFHATVTDPLGASASTTQAISMTAAPTSRVLRRTLFENRMNYGSYAVAGFQYAEGPMLTASARLAADITSGTPTGAATLGLMFTAQWDFRLVAVRLYKSPAVAGTIHLGVWSVTGGSNTLLSSQAVTWTSDAGGWQTIELAAPLAMAAGQDYMIGYTTPGGDYAFTPWVWNGQDTVVSPFWVKIGAGHYVDGASLAFPSTVGYHNYYIDPIGEWDVVTPAYGPTYFGQFPNGPQVSFPVAVFFPDPPFIQSYVEDCGINTIIGGGPPATDAYIAAIQAANEVARVDWWPYIGSPDGGSGANYEVALLALSDPAVGDIVVGYQVDDEPDLRATPYMSPAAEVARRNGVRLIDSTRPVEMGLSQFAVFNQGFAVQPPGASPVTNNANWRAYAAGIDLLALDAYSLAANDSFHPTGDELAGIGPSHFGVWAYPPQIGRMREFSDDRIAVFGEVETTSEVAGLPTPQQVHDATWALLIAGARGIVFFDHRFAENGLTQDFAAMLSNAPMATMVQSLSTRMQSLAEPLLEVEADLIESISSTNTTAGPKGGTYGVPILATSRLTDTGTYFFAQAIRPGATTATFTIPSMAGATLTVIGESRTVTLNGSGVFTDTFTADYQVHLYSTTTMPAFAAPVNTTAPSIVGTATTGSTLTCTTGTWTGVPSPTYSYRWQRNGANITGAIAAAYVLQVADEGQTIRCVVTAANSQGTASANSNTVTPTAPGTPYADSVLLKGPIGYWRLANLTDSSGNALTLTSAGSPTDEASLILTEPSNGAKGFAGSPDQLSRASQSILNPGAALTLVAWVDPSVIGGAEFFVAGKGPMRLEARDTSKPRFYLTTSAGDLWVDGTTVMATGTTYQLAGSYDGQWIRLYVNGVEEASFNWPTSGAGTIPTNAAPFAIGYSAELFASNGIFGFEGTIDEVSLYDRALLAAEVLDDYTQGTTGGGGGGGGGGGDPLSALSRVAWEGGPSYYTVAQTGAQMAKAEAAGWSDPSWFPIGVWSVRPDPDHVQAYLDIGINLAITVETSDNGPISNITSLGMHVFAVIDNPFASPAENNNWNLARVGSDPLVVAWFLGDEYDQGLSGFIGSDNEAGWLALMQNRHTLVAGYNDGRFFWTNFGSGGGTLSTDLWSPTKRDDMAGLVHGFNVDKYAYTSPVSREAIEQWAINWPNFGTVSAPTSKRAGTYGFLTEQARILTGETTGVAYASKPVFPFIETKVPLIDEAGEGVILYGQLEGAVWSAIAHEARGIAYFQPNGDPGSSHWPATDPNTGAATATGFYSLATAAVNAPDTVDTGLLTRVAQINSRVTELAPVLNTQSYVWNFGATGIDTMLKNGGDGFAYIFASVNFQGATGSKTFTLPAGITGATVTVLYESRTISVSGGAFVDSFANEYSHHIYKVAL
jgi:hypothetical protein